MGASDREVTFVNLMPLTRYSVTIAAISAIGQGARAWWNGTTLVDDITATSFFCRPSVWQVAAPPSATTICTADVTLTGKSIIHAVFTGHATCPSPALYASVLIDENIGIDAQEIGPAHTYSTGWETVRSGRIRFVDKVGVIQVRLVISSATNCQLSGSSLHGVVLNAHSPNFGRYGCVPSTGWSSSYPGGFVPTNLCSVSFNLTAPSLVQTFMNGHATVPSGWVYGVINYDNEVAVRYGNLMDKQVLVPAHTYSTTWETFGTGRSTHMLAGAHRVAGTLGANIGATYNGAAVQGFFMETKRDRTFLCTPSTWSVTSTGSTVVACEVTLNVTVPSVIFAEFSGHAQCSAGTCYGLVSVNNDGLAALNAFGGDLVQARGAALSSLVSTTVWEMFGGARVAEVQPGTVVVSMMLRCSSRGFFNGGGLSGYIVPRA